MSAEAIDFVLRIAAIAVLARLLLPQHFGLISMVTAVTAVAERFKDAGLSVATVQFPEISHGQISNLFWVNVLVGFLLAGGIFALAFPIAAFYGDPRLLQITWAIALSFVFGGATVQHYALMRRAMQFRQIALIQLGSSLGSIVIAVAVALLGGEYWALVIREVSRSALLFIGTWFLMPWRPGAPSRSANIKGMLGFGSNMALTNIVFYVSYSLDQAIVGKLFGAAALGFYRQGYNLVTAPAVQVSYPATLVGEPALARLRGRPEDYRRYLSKLLTVLCFVSMPSLFFIVVYADALVRVALGPGWEGAAGIFRILAVAYFMDPAATIVSSVMISCGFARRMLALTCVSAVTLLITFVLFAGLGPEGIALAHAVTFFVLLGPKLFISLRGTPASPALFASSVWRPLVCTLLTGLVMAIVHQSYDFGSAGLDLTVGLIGSVVVYLGLWLIVPGGRSQLFEMVAELKGLHLPRSRDAVRTEQRTVDAIEKRPSMSGRKPGDVARVALFGNFGGTNLGNEATLSAAILGLSEHMKAVQLYGIGVDPQKLTALHGIEAVAIDGSQLGVSVRNAGTARPVPVRLLRRIRHEWRELRRAARVLKGTSALLVVGTGLLEDDTGSWSWFTAILRWVVAARLSGSIVGFVSVGAGPPRPGLPRLLLRSSLRLAHYVSYRDTSSRESMRKIGVRVDRHDLFPDLAFCLSSADLPTTGPYTGGTCRIGLGVQGVTYAADTRVVEGSRERYLAALTDFVTATVPARATIDMIYGDSTYDLESVEDLRKLCQSRLGERDARTLTFHETATFEELMVVLAQRHVVISSRFHNLVLALLQGKPVIALGYNRKHFDLMKQFGLERFAHDWLSFDPKELESQLQEICANWAELSQRIGREVADSRIRLDLQFKQLAALCESRTSSLGYAVNMCPK